MTVNRRSADPMLDISMGMVVGTYHVNKFGRNALITTATDPEDVWSGGGIWIGPTFTNGAQVHTIESTSAADAVGGTGARTTLVSGLGENWELQSEVVPMAGQTPGVDTANKYWRIFRKYPLTCGSGGTNAGTITATAKTDGTVTAQIDAAAGQTLMAVYTVPAGKTAYMTGLYASLNRASGGTIGAEMALVTHGPANVDDGVTRARFYWGIESSGASVSLIHRIPYPSFPEMTDIVLRVNEVSASCDIAGGFDLILVDDPYPS